MSKSTIDFLTIRGFKSIREMESLKLEKLNILIGANGAGKSNLVSFFQMLRELVEQRFQIWNSKQGKADRVATHGVKQTKQMEFVMKFGRNAYELNLQPTSDDSFTFSKEQLYFDGNYGPTRPDLGSGHNESRLKEEMEKHQTVATFCYNAISNWKVFHFHDTSDTAGVKRIGSLHDNEYLRHDASNLAAYLYRIQRETPEVYEKIRKTVKLALPSFDDFVLKPQKMDTEEEQIRLQWKQLDSDYALWPSQLSDGSMRFICLTTALLQASPPSTIIIDEPELGLHPYAIKVLASLMKSASKNMQIVISTQSVSLLNEFSIEDLVVVETRNGASSFKRLDKEQFKEWLEQYSISELWEKNILGGRPSR